MGRNLNAKCQQCRRVGEKLFLKGDRCFTTKCAIIKKNYPPGVHGPKGRKRTTDFGSQLNEKQKAKKQYRLMEKDFKLHFIRALKKPGDTGQNLLSLLETRLDNTVYRLGFTSSRDQARQFVGHGLVIVNGKKVSIPSYQVKTGDTITVKDRLKKAKIFIELPEKLKKYQSPGWLNVSADEIKGKVLHAPLTTDLEKIGIKTQMIIEFYSR